MLIDWYPQIKLAHISLVHASGALFAVRGVALQLGFAGLQSRPVRVLSQIIDSALLLAAIVLLITLQLNPLTTGWLLAKLGLLFAYIGLGVMALRGATTRGGKAVFFVLALLCYAMMIAIARAHDPLGFLFWLPR